MLCTLYSLCMVFGHGARCRFSTKRHNECSWTKPKNQVWYLIFPPKSQSNQYNKNITLTDAYTHKILALIPSVTFYLFWVCTSLCLWISNILYSRRNLSSKSWTVIATPPSCVLLITAAKGLFASQAVHSTQFLVIHLEFQNIKIIVIRRGLLQESNYTYILP